MDSTLISHKQYLFAYCITDGTLDDMSEEERTEKMRKWHKAVERSLDWEKP